MELDWFLAISMLKVLQLDGRHRGNRGNLIA